MLLRLFKVLKQWIVERQIEKLHDIGNNGDWVRRNAARRLAALGFPEWEQWVKGDPDDFMRLGFCRNPRVFAWLVAAIEERRYRHAAIRGLGLLGDPRAVEPWLLQVLHHD